MLIVHETAARLLRLGDGQERPTGEQFDIVRKDPAKDHPLLQGWIQRDWRSTCSGPPASISRPEEARPATADFRPVDLKGAAFSADYDRVEPRMVAATSLGRLGRRQAAGGDRDLRRPLGPSRGRRARRQRRPRSTTARSTTPPAWLRSSSSPASSSRPAAGRTVLFLLDRRGEAACWARSTTPQNPVYPLAKMAANFTFDTLSPLGPAKDVVLIGSGQNQLEDLLRRRRRPPRPHVTPDPQARAGAQLPGRPLLLRPPRRPHPLLMAWPAVRTWSRAGARQATAGSMSTPPAATTSPRHLGADPGLQRRRRRRGAHRRVGRDLATSAAWPDWNDGSELKPIRAQTAAERR